MKHHRDNRFAGELDWNLLRTFFVIVEEGGISVAAKRLLLRQPTVSLALKRLETQMGARLLERGRGVFRLTAAGRALYRECRQIYGSIEQLQAVTSAFAGEITGSVRIAMASHVFTPLLDDTLRQFHADHPTPTFQIAVETSAGVAQAVNDQNASMGICLVNRRLPRLEYQIIYREFFGFFCGPGHPLFGRDHLSMNDLRGHAAVSFDTDDLADALRPVALLRRQHQLNQSFVGYSSHLEEVRRMIMCGLGIGPLPVHVADRDVRDGLLWRLPPYDKPPKVDIYLLTNPSRRYNSAEERFIEKLKSQIRTTPLRDRTYGPILAANPGG